MAKYHHGVPQLTDDVARLFLGSGLLFRLLVIAFGVWIDSSGERRRFGRTSTQPNTV
jgi:MFS-type transporter involved in bile tolerance (Atg22 family)